MAKVLRKTSQPTLKSRQRCAETMLDQKRKQIKVLRQIFLKFSSVGIADLVMMDVDLLKFPGDEGVYTESQ